MINHDKSDIIDRIQKLLSRKEEWGATEAEAATALNLAQRLMAQHNLTMAEVDAAKGEESESWTEADVWTGARSGIEETMAAQICEAFFFVQAYLCSVDRQYKGTGYRATVVWTRRFFGKPSNVESARYIYTQLTNAFDRLWTDYRIKSGASRTDRRPFVAGVAKGFMAKLRDERRTLETEQEIRPDRTPGTTLAVISDRVQQAFQEAHPQTTTRYTSGVSMNGAYSAGHSEGRNLNLSRPIGGNRKALPK